jgi:hypothetical protein
MPDKDDILSLMGFPGAGVLRSRTCPSANPGGGIYSCVGGVAAFSVSTLTVAVLNANYTTTKLQLFSYVRLFKSYRSFPRWMMLGNGRFWQAAVASTDLAGIQQEGNCQKALEASAIPDSAFGTYI